MTKLKAELATLKQQLQEKDMQLQKQLRDANEPHTIANRKKCIVHHIVVHFFAH
jgi:hypothetical protein